MRGTTAVLLLALATGCAAWPFGRRPQPADPRSLVDGLRTGGFVIYLVHTDTEWWRGDASPVVLDDCATQRLLSDSGRDQARAIGAGFERLLVPVGEVRASPYCRCADTARLAFDRVLLDSDLTMLGSDDAAPRAARVDALRKLLATAPPPGTNTVLVSHVDNFAAAGGPKLAPGEAAVVKPLAAGGYEVIARVPASAWTTMLSQ